MRDDERCGRSKEVNTPELIGQRVRVRVSAFSISSSFQELTSIILILVNNNFPNKLVDQKIKYNLYTIHQNNENINKNETINLYYRNQMHKNYKLDEQAITNIIPRHIKPRHIKPAEHLKQIKLILYYCTFKTSKLIINYYTNSPKSSLNQNIVI